jgi:hypothetical protein
VTAAGDLPALPPAVADRFPGYDHAALRQPARRDFVLARLMEEGTGAELRWLLAVVGSERLAALLAARGGRLLSRRSRAFWERVLGVASSAPHPLARELWPQA